ncbi:MAG: hypothetical protein WC455_18195, partial [Dehalococcoidia bacterium]
KQPWEMTPEQFRAWRKPYLDKIGELSAWADALQEVGRNDDAYRVRQERGYLVDYIGGETENGAQGRLRQLKEKRLKGIPNGQEIQGAKGQVGQTNIGPTEQTSVQGEGVAPGMPSTEATPAQPDENLRRSELSATTKAIKSHPAYKLGAEQAEAQGFTTTDVKNRTIYVEPKYEGDVIGYAGEDRRGRLWKHITFEKGKGDSWDSIAAEAGLPDDFDGFMQWLKDAVESGGKGSLNERAMEVALSSRDPEMELLAMKHSLLRAGFFGASINEELEMRATELAADYGLTEDDKNDILNRVKIKGKYAEEVSTPDMPGDNRQGQTPSGIKADTGVFGQPVFRPSTGSQQGLLPDAGEQWIGREPDRPLLSGLEDPQKPAQAPKPSQAQSPTPGDIAPQRPSSESQKADTGTVETPQGGDTGEPRLSSARQEWLNQHRRKLGLDGINSKSRRSWAQALAQAWEQGIPENALRIAAEINAKPRALSDVETAGLVVRSVELENEHAGIMAKIGPEKDAAMVADMSARAGTIESEYDAISRELFASGSEKGRALASQKLTINENFSLVAVKARAKAAKGAELTAKESAKIEELTTKLADQSAKVEALEKEIRRLQAEAMLKRLRGAQKLAAMTADQKAAKRSKAIEKVKALMKAGC